MDKLIDAIATQVPDLVALLLIVAMFVRYMEKRDAILQEITRELKQIGEALAAHAVATAAAIEEMHRTVDSRRRPRPKRKM